MIYQTEDFAAALSIVERCAAPTAPLRQAQHDLELIKALSDADLPGANDIRDLAVDALDQLTAVSDALSQLSHAAAAGRSEAG